MPLNRAWQPCLNGTGRDDAMKINVDNKKIHYLPFRNYLKNARNRKPQTLNPKPFFVSLCRRILI
jgi:hypothetical protein